MIYYFCPDRKVKSGGIRTLYRHVQLLQENNLESCILHTKNGFKVPDMPDVPIRYLTDSNRFTADDVIVIPEGYPNVMEAMQHTPARKVVIALNWDYVYRVLPEEKDWRDFNIERVITQFPMLKKMTEWAMNIPTKVVPYAVDPELYYYEKTEKRVQITYFDRKAECIENLKKLLHSRNPAYIQHVNWEKLGDLSEKEYAETMRTSSVYLALGTREGLNISVLEAWGCGTLVAGFDGIGLEDKMVGSGNKQNAIKAQNGDYVRLAMKLEPYLKQLLEEDRMSWKPILKEGLKISREYSKKAEMQALLNFWNAFETE